MSLSRAASIALAAAALAPAGLRADAKPPSKSRPLRPVVQMQEDVYRYEPANNGAGPMWCGGSTCLVRVGEDVFVSGTDSDGKRISENRLIEIAPDGRPSPHVKVALEPPFTSFFTATVRAGCRPSATIDLLGQCAGRANTIRYARIVER